MDDAALLKAIATGDDVALRELFERHASWMASRLRRVMPAGAVEDVLQETFFAVWRNAWRYRGEGPPGAWLWGVARRQVANWFRKNGRDAAELDVDAPGPDDTAALAADRVDLERALAELGAEGDPQREIARLAWEEERSMAEVAAWLDVPEGTVKSRLHRARQLLRRTLRGGGDA